MAGSASFTTKDGTITLMSGTNDPFLNYSISVGEVVKAGDGTVLDVIYNISVDGLFVAEGDITTDGARLANLIGKQKTRWQPVADMEDFHGTLLITSPNGTQAFTGYAELTGLTAGETDDQGINTGTYSAEFTGRYGGKKGSARYIESGSESWSIEESGEYSRLPGVGSDNSVYKVWTITQTLSAKAVNQYNENGWQKSGHTFAKEWCDARLSESPARNIDIDIADKSDEWDAFSTAGTTLDGAVGINVGTLQFFNKKRTGSAEPNDGSYTYTTTWTASEWAASHDLEISEDIGAEGLASVTVSGSIQGYDSNAIGSLTVNAVDNALGMLSAALNEAYTLALAHYETVKTAGQDGGPDGESTAPGEGTACAPDEDESPKTLRITENSRTVSKNLVTGSVSYSVTFADKDDQSEEAADEDNGVITEKITVTDNNEDHSNQTVAIISIIGRAGGPIFQDMGTTNERKRSISVDWTMDKCNREKKPSTLALTAANRYKPTGGYQQSKSEQWTAATGAYTLNIEWVY
tara:strand:+ start:22961 stop:24529 length:1569 start_codon:yes stop_codon:yes gene_type:complete